MQNKMVYKPCLIQLLIDGSHKMKEFTHVDVKRSLIMICKFKKSYHDSQEKKLPNHTSCHKYLVLNVVVG